MSERYLNREIDEKFSFIKEALGRIEVQTTRTNGRVTKLEDETEKMRDEIAKAKTLAWVVRIGVGAVFAVLIALISSGQLF